MFCGIVEHIGILESIEQQQQGVLFRIRSKFNDFKLGESIAVDGVCLTVTASENNLFDCALSPESYQVTIAKQYGIGQPLNLERAMLMGDRIGGHLVTGHVDGTLIVEKKKQHDTFIELHFSGFSNEQSKYLMPKGCVTINGVSLTVNTVDDKSFSVMLIPHTLAHTNLARLALGDCVNVEWDYMAKLVARQLVKNTNVIGEMS